MPAGIVCMQNGACLCVTWLCGNGDVSPWSRGKRLIGAVSHGNRVFDQAAQSPCLISYTF